MNISPLRINPRRNIVPMANVLVPQHMFFGVILDAIGTLVRTRGYLDYWNERIGSDSLKESLVC